jgi:hypothetical protein
MNKIVKKTGVLGYVVGVALLITALAAAPATAAPSKGRDDTWAGQVVRHEKHFDYRGSACPTSAETCIMVLANFRIVPLTPQASAGLRRAAGGRARLVGYKGAADNAKHNGTLYVRRVERA